MKNKTGPRVVYCGTEDGLFKRISKQGGDFVLESKSINFQGSPQNFAHSKKASVLLLRIRKEFDLKHQEWLSRNDHTVPVIVLCHDGSLQTAIHALQYGVFDYFNSSQSIELIVSRIQEAILWRSVMPLKRSPEKRNQLLVGMHPEIIMLNEQARTLARDSKPVLVYGELGTGKGHLARGLHRLCRRTKLVHYDCRILQQLSRYEGLPVPELVHKRLLEVRKDSPEIFLYLSHAQHLNPDSTQELIERSVRVSSKVVAAFQSAGINTAFQEKMSTKTSPIAMPPLKKRKEDIPILTEYFMKAIAKKRRIRQKVITQEMILVMQEYSWPGNVQELQSCLDRMMVIEPSNILTAASWRIAQGHRTDVHVESVNQFSVMIEDVLKNSDVFWGSGSLYEDFMLKMKKMLVDLVLPKVDYNQATAARMLGISRNTLREILKSYDPVS